MAIEIPDFDPSQAITALLLDAANPSLDPIDQARARDARRIVYYATELAEGDEEALAPRYRITDWGNPEDPSEDILVEDPARDPRISALASNQEALREVRKRLQDLQAETIV